ncbi:MAG TPA: hypothetical protein VFE24_07245 [Pirellulales bacterium]|jgi:hypothetical protein|nr:hypothetical protein [Pirellulales bacterium]
MRQTFPPFLLLALVPLLLPTAGAKAQSNANPAATMSGADAVRGALAEVDRWVGPSENGNRWRDFLHTAQLREQLNQGSSADPQAVADLLAIYSSSTPGLERPRFQAVRAALQNWYGELAGSTPAGLAKLILASKGHYHPVSPAEVEAGRAALSRAVQTLNQYLGANPNADAWRGFLNLSALQAELQPEGKITGETLHQVEKQLAGSEPGLDTAPFFQLRQAVSHFQRVLAASGDMNAAAEYDQRLDELAASLDAYGKNPTNADYQKTAALLRDLSAEPETAPVVAALRRRFGAPNFFAEISGSIVAAGVNRDVDEVMPLTDNILGTEISGTGHTVGTVRMHLVPNPDRAVLDTVLLGQTYTNTVGQHDPVTIFSTGVTSISGIKRLQMDANGMFAYAAGANAITCNHVNGLCVNRNHFVGLIERAAWKRIGQSQGEAEAVGSEHAQARIAERLNQQVDPLVAKNNLSLEQKVRGPLKRNDAYPQSIHYLTTSDYVAVQGIEAAGDQIAAPEAPPELPNHDGLSIRFHESAINNLAVKMYGGRRISRNDVKSPNANQTRAKLRDIFIMDEPADAQKPPEEPESNDKNISFVFDREKPVVITLADKTFSIFMRVNELTVDDENSGDWDITAHYLLEQTPAGLQATLQAEAGKKLPDVVPAGFDRKTGGKIPGSKLKYVGTLRRKFGEQLKPEYKVKYVLLPGELKKAGPLFLTYLQCDHGWLGLSYQPEAAAAPAPSVSIPAGETAVTIETP